MKRFFVPLFLGLLFSGRAAAFVVGDIRLDGLQRVSAGTVFSALPVAVGDDVSTEDLATAARSLFAAGYFQDIHLGREGDVLVVELVERPSISKIEISGNKKIAKKDLLKGLKSSGLAEGEVFRQSTLEAVRVELERQYVAQGRYGAVIDTRTRPMPNNRVAVSVAIKEGSESRIQDINIVGSHVFSRETLLDLFQLQPSNWLSWYSNNDRYSREKLSGDLERLRSWYLDRGYINFTISSTQVSITPDKTGVYVTINIEEGKQYRVGDVRLDGQLVVDEKELTTLLKIREGQVFSRRLMTLTEEDLTHRLGEEGYAFASFSGVPQPHEDDSRVDITFFAKPGQRVYVRRINFHGNLRTADEVLRREVRQMEGGVFNQVQLEQSRTRLNRLGYLGQVEMETVPVPGSSSMVDINYSVDEQPSGSVTASLGYSQAEGLLLGASLDQKNFLGSGNQVKLQLNSSNTRRQYSFSFLDPYYTIDGVSRGFSLYYGETDLEDSNVSTYNIDSWGGSVTYGYPLSEISRLRFGLSLESKNLATGADPALPIADFIANQGGSFTDVAVNGGLFQSALDNGLLPGDGWSQSVFAEVSTPVSDLLFYKLNYKGQYFYPVFKKMSLRFSSRLGYGGAYGKTPELPFFENFYGGGFGSVRGYRDNTLGPRARRGSGVYDPVGGNILMEGSVELLFPPPFVGHSNRLRTSAFLDVGNVFSTQCGKRADAQNAPLEQACYSPSFEHLRYSVGLGMTWLTPLGPLTFSLAKALKVERGDDPQIFQFSLGAPF
ncbi:MAG: outer membrane protein assembly factor BamA [Kistimonas sp.]|nr:outer membrane protein assembly factor BamA [Kistimonas sp.]